MNILSAGNYYNLYSLCFVLNSVGHDVPAQKRPKNKCSEVKVPASDKQFIRSRKNKHTPATL